jgi:Tfp pilus assembly protein PilO
MNPFLIKLANLSYRQTFIISLLVGGFYYLMFFDNGEKLDTQIKQIQTKVTEQEVIAVESDKAQQDLEKIKSSLANLETQFKSAAQQLPTEISMAEILKSIDTLARSSNVSIKEKEPKTSLHQDFLEISPLRVKAEGNFSEIVMFIYYISSMQRISRLKSFSISMVAMNDRNMDRKGKLILDGEVESYRFLSEAEREKVKKK